MLRPTTDAAFKRLYALPFEGGEDRRLIGRGPGGQRLHYMPVHALVRVEGRAGAIIAGDEGAHDLRSAGVLPEVARSAQALVAEFCGELVAETEAARLDIAVDLRCSRDDGLAFLRVLRHVKAPRSKLMMYENPRDHAPETVAFVTPSKGKILLRAYDKGLESGLAPRGELIRIERQLVLDRARRRRPEQVTNAYIRDRWSSHLRSLSTVAEVAAVGRPGTLAQRVADLITSGVVSPAKGRALLGAAYLLPTLTDQSSLTRSTRFRWEAELRQYGLHAVRDEMPDLAAVPLPRLLRECADRFDMLAMS